MIIKIEAYPNIYFWNAYDRFFSWDLNTVNFTKKDEEALVSMWERLESKEEMQETESVINAIKTYGLVEAHTPL